MGKVKLKKIRTEMTKFMLETENSRMTLKIKPVMWRLNLRNFPRMKEKDDRKILRQKYFWEKN